MLARVLPGNGLVLEVASGSGEFALWFAQHLRPLAWQPSDPDPACRRSIAAHAAAVPCPSLRAPIDLAATAAIWPIERADAMVCINMAHIAPWAATEGLIAGAARVLPPGGVLYLYGPYRRGGKHTAPSNAASATTRAPPCSPSMRLATSPTMPTPPTSSSRSSAVAMSTAPCS